jgi:hypothetical protein
VLEATLGQRTDAVLAVRAAADDDHVGVFHCGSSSPVCSRTMYSA